MKIVKASGEVDRYDEGRLRNSLRGAGAADDTVERTVRRVEKKLTPRTSTAKIYRRARSSLRREGGPCAARYSLKRAVMGLGPTGYPFEHLWGRVLEARGYDARVGVTLNGMHVTHEVDVDASRDGRRVLCECKYHRSGGRKSDVKVALYVFARSLDLRAKLGPEGFEEFCLVTNTKFTSDAVAYGEGAGLTMISWEHPFRQGVRHAIEEFGMQPITALCSLRKRDKERLLNNEIILCRDLSKNGKALQQLRLSPARRKRLDAELRDLRHIDLSADSPTRFDSPT